MHLQDISDSIAVSSKKEETAPIGYLFTSYTHKGLQKIELLIP
jgi:hypothetical protein